MNARVGMPYDPHSFHCWTLAQQTVMDLYGYGLPVVAAPPPGRRTKAAFINGHHEMANWVEVDPPASTWAVAFMYRRGSPRDVLEHAGVFFPIEAGLIFHCDQPDGVIIDSIWELPRLRTWAMPRLFIRRT